MAEPRFARYRSVRKHQHEAPPMPPLPPEKPSSLSRSMSRYHRPRPATTQQTTLPPIQPDPLPAQAGHAPPRRAQSTAARPQQTTTPAAARHVAPDTLVERVAAGPTDAAREEARRILEGEGERQRGLTAQIKAEKRARLDEARRLKAQREAAELELRDAETREKDVGARQQAAGAQRDDDGALRAVDRERPRTAPGVASGHDPEPPPLPSSPQSPGSGRRKDRFGFLRRRRDDPPPSTDTSGAPKPSQSGNDGGEPETIKPGGRGVVPGIDAPISAVNAGDRRVLVECNAAKILLPVTPTTTVMDLIRSASTCLSEPIDPKASVLLEAFGKVGVQRPLRKYERIRDVLNSWDDDAQDSLIIVDSPTGGHDHDLGASSVPTEKPEGFSCWMHYSQKPGKWSKRWITLRNDGQITLSKNESGKDATNVCHMSDFDIYTPTARVAARKVKPPKKFCFAIKSQQKSTMFMSTASFVHFFCSNDKNAAAAFYSSVQGWRSWYLVNVMGEGQKKSDASEPTTLNAPGTRKISGGQTQGHTHRPSKSIDSHYQLGSYKPLLDMTRFEPGPAPEPSGAMLFPAENTVGAPGGDGMHQPARKMSTRTRAHPPAPLLAHLTAEGKGTTPSHSNSLTRSNTQSDDDGTFAAGGLLGRTYSQRQKALGAREKNAGPFTEGPSLLNSLESGHVHAGGPSIDNDGIRPQRMSSVRSAHRRHSGDIKRSATTRGREMPRPLVDLTPQYKAPPQFQKKGKGYKPGQVGPGGLIDCATSPDVPITIPPSQDWRAGRNVSGPRPTTSGGAGVVGAAAERTKSLRGQGLKVADAFTGRGLIATVVGPTAGVAAPHGHGVTDMSKAKGPMIDVSEKDQFVPGSLLANVAALQPSGPIIDREKRRSIEVASGEGL